MSNTDRHGGRGVLWDMDGVIVNTEEQHYIAWRKTLAEHGIGLTAEEFKYAFGLRNAETVKHFFGEHVTSDFIRQVGDKKEGYYSEAIKKGIGANPGAVRLIKDMKMAGSLQAVASSAPRQSVNLIIGFLQVANFFDVVVAAEDVKTGKPNPEVFLVAAQRLGLEPTQCVVIEDAMAGIQAAKDGGMKCIAVTTTNSAEQLKAADLVVETLEDLTAHKVLWMLS